MSKLAPVGHNNPPNEDNAEFSGQRLKTIVARIEKLEADKAGIAADIREIYAEAKGTGFNVKTIRQVVRLRKQREEQRREDEELLELYKAAIGME